MLFFVSGQSSHDIKVLPNDEWIAATGPIMGPIPAGVDELGIPQ